MRHHLPDYSLQRARNFLVALVYAFDFTLKFLWRRFRQLIKFAQQIPKRPPQLVPSLPIQSRSWREAFRIVFGIDRPLTTNAPQLVFHPVVHVEDELSDRVGKSRDLTRRQFGGNIFYARDGIDVRASAAKQFR